MFRFLLFVLPVSFTLTLKQVLSWSPYHFIFLVKLFLTILTFPLTFLYLHQFFNRGGDNRQIPHPLIIQ